MLMASLLGFVGRKVCVRGAVLARRLPARCVEARCAAPHVASRLDSLVSAVGLCRTEFPFPELSPGTRMSFHRRICITTAAFLLSFGAGHAQQPFPSKSVTLVVAFATGGSTDIITRIIAKELTA